MSAEWHCIVKERNITKKYLPYTEVYEHPLKPITVTVIDNRNARKLGNTSKSSSATSSSISFEPLSIALDGCDPLTLFAKQDAIDPLSQMAAEYESGARLTNIKKGVHKDIPQLENAVVSWQSRRSAILSKFTTAEKLTITTSFLSGGGSVAADKTQISEKVKHRLEQLDDFDDGSVHQMLDLTQQEYMLKIEQLNHELVQAWTTDQRVKALKIAIQCSKLLADTSVMQFYPSQFVLITDILDIFGKLVYERLRTKAEYIEPGCTVPKELPETFTPDMVPAMAKETCQNWFYKIASIRELLPRLYVEIAILKSYSFLTQTEFDQALLRLTSIIRGIGDPLVAAYARCYLCRVGMTVTSDRTFIKRNLNDFLFVYHTMFGGGIRSEIARQRLDITGYLTMYTPALDWIMQALAAQDSDVMLDDIIMQCQDKKNNGLLLNTIMLSFRPSFIASRAMQFVQIIANCTTEGVTKSQLFRSLGISLNLCPPPSDQRVAVLNGAWKTIGTLTHTGEYISCVEPWAQYTSAYFGLREINKFMEDVLAHMGQNRAFEGYYVELQSIVDKIVAHTKAFEGLLTTDHFLPMIDLFQKESIKLTVCKNIMQACRNNIDGSINDPVVVNALMYICKMLNDTVNELTVEDERRNISALISNFIKRADYDRDFEQQLTFYVDARAAFPNLDGVLVTLVHCANKLAIDTRRIVAGQHTRKTGAFVKACAAYSFITIPSIVSVMQRMDLYLLSGQVSLLNGCLGQADACFEVALKLIPDLPKTVDVDGKPKSTESYLVSFVCNFLSTLIMVPDSPEQGVLFLSRTLLDCVRSYPFDQQHTSLPTIYLHVLDQLCVAAQDSYPYHIQGVVSNDELYGSDPKFIAEINAMCGRVVDQLLIQLKGLGDQQLVRAQTSLALDLFIRVVCHGDISKEKMYQLAGNLWNLSMKNRAGLDPKLPGKILMKIERIKGAVIHHQRRNALEELTTKMKTRM